MNIDCEIIEENNDNNTIGYNEIINLVDISIEQKINLKNNDKMVALKIFYNENYTKKYLEKIADYYDISKRKKRKSQLIKNEMPAYELISGAAIALGALMLIIPGFATDFLGFLLIVPITRKLIFGKLSKKFIKEKKKQEPFIEGDFEEIKDDDDRKI